MPRLSDTMEEGELAKWLKQVGDPVAKGDAIAEIETDKATMDLEAFEDGVLEQHLVEEGTLVPIGAPVAVIGDGSGTAPAPAAPAQDAAPAKAGPEPAAEEPEVVEGSENSVVEVPRSGSLETTAPEIVQVVEGSRSARLETTGTLRISPLARKIAKDNNLDLSTIQGTGADGRIIRVDVEAALAGGGAQAAAPSQAAPTASAPTVSADDTTRVPASRIQKVAAKRLAESQLVPHFFLTAVAEVDALLDLRKQINKTLEPLGKKVSVNDLIIKAVAVVLAEHPEANARWDVDAIVQSHRVNVGMAVATDEGLLVPVLRDADRLSVVEISELSVELAGKARDGKLSLDEMSGGTFSVSNLGMFGIDEFTAMLNPPEAGILAVGTASPVPQLRDGALVNVNRLKITLTCDHRVMDGAVGAAFLRDVVQALESPLRTLL